MGVIVISAVVNMKVFEVHKGFVFFFDLSTCQQRLLFPQVAARHLEFSVSTLDTRIELIRECYRSISHRRVYS